jgi:hypothetical protein
LAERGGVIGIYRVPTADDVIAHIEHAVRVCGEDHVGIGSDLSITPIDPTPEYWAMHREFVTRRKAAGTAAPAERCCFMCPISRRRAGSSASRGCCRRAGTRMRAQRRSSAATSYG